MLQVDNEKEEVKRSRNEVEPPEGFRGFPFPQQHAQQAPRFPPFLSGHHPPPHNPAFLNPAMGLPPLPRPEKVYNKRVKIKLDMKLG